jgi:hypothetical protein
MENNKKFQTPEQITNKEKINRACLQHAVSLHQGLDLLRYRLIDFDDLTQSILLENQKLNKILSELQIDSEN